MSKQSTTIEGESVARHPSELSLYHQRCSVCGSKVKARGLCVNHYAKYRRGTLEVEAPTSRAFSDDERESKYVEVQPDGCWHWTGGLDSKGYGKVLQGQAHRWMYERKVGPIPEGMDLDHDCHNRDGSCPGGVDCSHRRCVNPDHLSPASRKENLANGNGPGGAKYSRPMECVNGHDLSSEDSIYRHSNARGGISHRCKACAKQAANESYLRSKA